MKTEERTILTEMMGASPKVRIINFLLDFPANDFTKEEIVKALGFSKTTFYKNFGSLVEFSIVKATRKIGKAVLYKVNTEHPLIRQLRQMEKNISLYQPHVHKERAVVVA